MLARLSAEDGAAFKVEAVFRCVGNEEANDDANKGAKEALSDAMWNVVRVKPLE